MIIIKRVNYRKLKRDLLDYVGPSGIWPLIGSVDSADEEELLEIAEELGYDVSDYILEDEDFDEDEIEW
ncbi:MULTISPECIES: hypothetical protein [Caloramator]|uniref:Uncharacterized protein n=1 Tax=Caloramator proteoclasticus DSM 10124 TaxID=1121262 RepID=A0A1M4XK90_9CLOT|nr:MULTISPECIES: hypothetical protein [Caloramator]SHE93915.1 hypothetical protein SAMN02746091_01442 [Caloramator proteoclasticus DSM 10124]